MWHIKIILGWFFILDLMFMHLTSSYASNFRENDVRDDRVVIGVSKKSESESISSERLNNFISSQNKTHSQYYKVDDIGIIYLSNKPIVLTRFIYQPKHLVDLGYKINFDNKTSKIINIDATHLGKGSNL